MKFIDILLTRKERVAVFAAWDQSKLLEKWWMTPHNLVAEDAMNALTPGCDCVNVANPKLKVEFTNPLKSYESHLDSRVVITRVTNVQSEEFTLVDRQGLPWRHPSSCPPTSAVIMIR